MLSITSLLLSVLATSALASPQYGGGSGSGSSSSSSSTAAAASASSSSSSSSASNVHKVTVGPSLTFTPDSLTAAQGDWVEFTFNAGHSVAESTFAAPCQPISGSSYIYSGFPNQGDVWRFQVNSTDPLWLYCSAAGHCEAGMALVVNPPASGNTLAAYKSAAANAQGSSPANVQGGVFGALAASSGSPSSSASATGSSSSASASASASPAASSGNAGSSNTVRNGLMLAGAVAAGVAAIM